MAVSQNTQKGFYGNHASEVRYVKTQAEAEAMKDAMRQSGAFRKVSHTVWNNGTRAQPLPEYKVMGWK
jgi:hypothetical protein